MNKIWILLCSGIIILSSFNSSARDHDTVKIFIAWPGATYLPAYDWKIADSKPTGVEPALIERILEIAGYDYIYVSDYNYTKYGDVRIDAITDGVADISIRSITINDERSNKVNFSQPYYYDGISALVLKNSGINRKADFEDKIVFANVYTTAYDWAMKNLPDSKLVSDEDFYFPHSTGILLLGGFIDVYLGDRSFLANVSLKYPQLKVLEETYTEEPFGIAVNKNKGQLLKDINSAIDKLKRTGELEEITSEFKR